MSQVAPQEIALAHHWLVTQRGGESVFDALLESFPSVPVFTLVCDRQRSSQCLKGRTVRASFLQQFPRATRWYPYYLPFFPKATEHLDLREFQVVISSDAATMKGVRTAPGAIHICYCHTPMRYVWSGYEDYARTLHPLARPIFARIAEWLRRWDFEAAQRVTRFIANSKTVAGRIRRYYGRESVIIYPPVDANYFVPDYSTAGSEEYYVLVSQLVAYKRADLVVDAFNRAGHPLVVIGDGPERGNLERRARANIQFLGAQPREVIRRHLQRARAFVFAGEEDFGIVMAEALSCGTPVLAYGRGGAVEIVQDGHTGILFDEQTVDSLLDGLAQLEKFKYDPVELRHSALRFNRDRFTTEFRQFVRQIINDRTSPAAARKAPLLTPLEPVSSTRPVVAGQMRK